MAARKVPRNITILVLMAAVFVAGVFVQYTVSQSTPNPGHDFAELDCSDPTGCITPSWLKAGSVGNSKLQDYSVTRDKIDNGAVNASKIKDNHVTSAKINDGTIVEVDVDTTEICTSGDTWEYVAPYYVPRCPTSNVPCEKIYSAGSGSMEILTPKKCIGICNIFAIAKYSTNKRYAAGIYTQFNDFTYFGMSDPTYWISRNFIEGTNTAAITRIGYTGDTTLHPILDFGLGSTFRLVDDDGDDEPCNSCWYVVDDNADWDMDIWAC